MVPWWGMSRAHSWGIGVNLLNHCDECNTPDDDLMYCYDCARDFLPGLLAET